MSYIKKAFLSTLILGFFVGFTAAYAQLVNVNALRGSLQNNPDALTRADILLKLAEYYGVDNPDSTLYFTDKAAGITEAAKVDTIGDKLRVFQALNNCVKTHTKNPGTAFNPVIALCRQQKDSRNELRSWKLWAHYMLRFDTAKTMALACLRNADSVASKLKDVNEEFESRKDIADIFLLRGDYYSCEKQLKAILADPRLEHSSQAEFVYDLTTSLYASKGDYHIALRYALKSEKYMEATRDTSNIFNLYGRLSGIYGDLGVFDKAIYYSKKAMANALAQKNTDFVFKVGSGIVFYMIKDKKPGEALKFIQDLKTRYKFHDADDAILYQKDLGNCYAYLKDWRKAEVSYKEMIRLGETADPAVFPVDEQAINYHTIGNFYLSGKRFLLAKDALLKSLEVTKGKGSAGHLQTLYESLFKADSGLGNYLQAIKYLQRSHAIKDSTYTLAKQQQFGKLQAEYQSEKKDKEIQLSQAKIRSDALEKGNLRTTRNWVFAGLVLLLLVSGLLYRLSRIRKKNNGQINAKNLLLQKLLEEKEWLLKEVHHRVKNNLHTVICLLESQAAYLENDALKAIETSQHRIYAMSLIHHKLYQADDINSIDMDVYLDEFIDYLDDSFGNQKHITILRNIEPIKLGASQAIPVGLIINETVTNAFKYAFPDSREGTISITLKKLGKVLELSIKDDGVGMKLTPVDEEAEGSLGMELIKGLSSDLNGELTREIKNGLSITIRFEINPLDGSAFNYQTTGEQIAHVG